MAYAKTGIPVCKSAIYCIFPTGNRRIDIGEVRIPLGAEIVRGILVGARRSMETQSEQCRFPHA